MAGIPKVKIQFDADLDGLKKGTAAADKEVGGFADKVGEFGKKAAAAFAIAAAPLPLMPSNLLSMASKLQFKMSKHNSN